MKLILHLFLFITIAVQSFAVANIIDDSRILDTWRDLDQEDFIPSQEVVQASWKSSLEQLERLQTKTNADGFIPLQIYMLSDFNAMASNIWDKILDCYQGDLKKARYDYIQNQLSCSKAELAEISSEILMTKTNLVNWIHTTLHPDTDEQSLRYLVQGIPIPELRSFHMPILHPLLGQFLMEIMSQIRQVFYKQSSRDDDITGSNYRQQKHILNECDTDKKRNKKKCQTYIKGRTSFNFVHAVLRTSPLHCQNYGLYPNISLFLMAEGELVSNSHPMHHNYWREVNGFRYISPFSSCWSDGQDISNFLGRRRVAFNLIMGFIEHYAGLNPISL